ncbi:MAG: sodium/glutamate symporter [Pseudomonadota bacterium]
MTLLDVGQAELLAMSIVVLFAGMQLNAKSRFLTENFIPPAVTGGLLFALIAWALRAGEVVGFEFDLELRDYLLLVFFSTVGLSVRVETLLTGGKTLPLLVAAAGTFLVLQNSVGVAIATLLEADPVYGLMAGSISFAGGHGTAIAWGAQFEATGVPGASSIGLAFATFGLVAGGMIGGPIARVLMGKDSVIATETESANPIEFEAPIETGATAEAKPTMEDDWLRAALGALLLVTLCVSIGGVVNVFLEDRGLKLPGFLTSMFVGIVLANLLRLRNRPSAVATIDRFGTVSLHIFLAMSMMTIELWTLGGAFQAIVLVLFAQVLLMTIFAMVIVFYLAGRDYDAVVIAAGFSGLGLGATPVAIANMNAVTSRYGPSPKAMILIPLIGAFFIDLLNAGTIQFFLGWLQG